MEETMADAGDFRYDAGYSESQDGSALKAAELELKAKELAAFRDAGVLTEAELEEQMAKLRWGLP
jgi:hypothetical protein